MGQKVKCRRGEGREVGWGAYERLRVKRVRTLRAAHHLAPFLIYLGSKKLVSRLLSSSLSPLLSQLPPTPHIPIHCLLCVRDLSHLSTQDKELRVLLRRFQPQRRPSLRKREGAREKEQEQEITNTVSYEKEQAVTGAD